MMDTFTEELRRVGMMLCYGRSIEEIHDVLMPEDEGRFFLLYMAAKRIFEAGVAQVSDGA